MPTWQGMEFLERVLDALAGQRLGLPWDLHVVDSGSNDGTWECLQARRAGFPVPLRLARIPQEEFDHGDTRNLLAARSTGDLLVYLTQDAIPSSRDWLALLLRNFGDARVGAAYCRNVARQDAKLLTKVFCRSDPGYSPVRVEARLPDAPTWSRMSPDERRLLFNFNDVASAIRREIWERHPFPRTTMGEDVLMARAIVEAGYTVAYDVEATVDHSHDYGPDKQRWRGQVDGKFNVEWMQRRCIASASDVEVLAERLVQEDLRVLALLKTPPSELASLRLEARELRGALALGLFEGGCSPRRYPRTALRDRAQLRVLQVVPAAPAGSLLASDEAGELELAQALRRRGHRVCVLAIADQGRSRSLDLQRVEQEGLSVFRANEAADPASLDAAFRSLLLCEQPDLVHFHDMRASMLGLLRTASELGMATLAGLDDERLLAGLDPAVLLALNLADLRLCSDLGRRKAWLAAADFDPQTLAYSARASLASGAKSVTEAAVELEFRYRALCCIVRSEDAEGRSFETPGAWATLIGEGEVQGPDWLLLRPNSAAEFALPRLPEGPLTLELVQHALAAEPGIILAGRALVDGVEIGRFAPTPAPAQDETVRQRIECGALQGARVLRLEPQLADGAAGAHLRICKLALQPRRAQTSAPRAQASRPAADLALLAEELRVHPGAAIERARLPRVTIVVPNLDGREVLADCLGSIAELDYPHERLEVVLVDNASSDGSRELVRERFPRVRILPLERNRGFAAACNAGARAARDAALLAFVNNDMRFDRGFLRELVAPLLRGECAASTARIMDWSGQTIDTSGTGTTFLGIAVQPGYGQPPRPEQLVPRKTLFGCGGAMAVDPAVLWDVGGFDEDYFAYYEDLDLGWRMWVLGHEIHYVPGALCYHHHSHTSRRFPAEVVRLVMIRNSLTTCIKNYDDENLARVLPAMLALAIRRAYLKSGLDERTLRIESASVEPTLDGRAGADSAGSLPIQRMGAADLVAINDVLGNWDYWMRRRREVQSRRKRSDDEIQRLFLDPLACVEGDGSYAALQAELIARLGLDAAFRRS